MLQRFSKYFRRRRNITDRFAGQLRKQLGDIGIAKGFRTGNIIYFIFMSGGELATRIPIFRKVLTEQLKELEKDGLILRKVYKEIPRKVEYTLSDLGNSLSPVFDEMAEWGRKNLSAKNEQLPS